jgi:serine protease AprX
VKRIVVVLALAAVGYGMVTPELERHMATAQSDQRLPVHIVLREQFDAGLLNRLVDGMPRAQRRVEVARILEDFSAGQQKALLAWLEAEQAQGRVADVRPLWIVNAVYCEATPAVIRALSERAEVHYVNYDLAYAPDLLEPEEPAGERDEVAWGVEKVNAPAVWAQGYTGQGIICGHIDTGCNYNHPDLADHMWTDPNYPNHGWNFENNNNDPMDVSGHGTHTAGSVASDGTAGSQCGVAPDAQIMVCRVRTVADSVAESQCWQAMQFCVSPPLSPANGADLYTMSLGWQISWNPHQATWRQTADNVNAAGLSQIVAAGNERSLSPPNSCRCPGNVPPPWWNPQNTGTGTLSGIMSIGATDVSDNIASFSSRGPVTWASVAPFNDYPYPPGLTRPDVSAPGVNVKSCSYTGGYTNMDGTSMATPHVAGAVCLMLSKNPNLTPARVDSILEITAVDLGPAGKDNDYGAGRIDALEAVNHVFFSPAPVMELVRVEVQDSPPGGNNNGRVDRGETARLLVTLRNVGEAASANTVGWLRSFDYRLVVSDSAGNWGTIPSGGSVADSLDRFEVRADERIPEGTQVQCSLCVAGDSVDFEQALGFVLRVGDIVPAQALADHDTGYCKLTVSCFGSVGFDRPVGQGSGFHYPKTDPGCLFYSSLAVGNRADCVADRFYGRPWTLNLDQDFGIGDSLLNVAPATWGDQHYTGSFRDTVHLALARLRVYQNSVQSVDTAFDDFVVLMYDFRNQGADTLRDLYAGILADLNASTVPNRDVCRTDAGRRFTYVVSDSTRSLAVGIKVLEPRSYANLSALDINRYVRAESCVTDSQKFRFLDGTYTDPDPLNAGDWGVVVSVGPFVVPPETAYRFAVAFVGGRGEDEALEHADSAQAWYVRNVAVAESPASRRFAARSLVLLPNPFASGTRVRYETPVAGHLRVTALDVSGRTVSIILDRDVPAGRGELVWQPTGLANGVYFVRGEMPDGSLTQRALLAR